MDNDAVKNWPNWLRWTVAYPAAVVGAVIGAWLFRIFLGLFGQHDQQWWYDIIQSGMIGAFFVYISAWFVPRAHKLVSLISMAIVIALSFFGLGIIFLATSYGSKLENPLEFYLNLAAFIGAAVFVVVAVHQIESDDGRKDQDYEEV